MITMRRLVPAAFLLLALAACNDNGGDGSTVEATPHSASCTTPPPLAPGATVVTASVVRGKVATAHGQWSVRLGSNVRIVVLADVADEVHVHSYDKKADTVPGCPTAIDFVANIPGTVEVELEAKGLHLFDLKAS
jgi:predicted small secreted protein